MVLRKILMQMHWLIGLVAGLMLAFSGLTGGLMAFGPELSDYFSGGYQRIDTQSAATLPTTELYARAQAAFPGRRVVDITTYADSTRPARLRLAPTTSFIGPTSPVEEVRMINPYSGAILPLRPFGRSVTRVMHWLHEVHQGHWGGPDDVAPRIASSAIGFATMLLFFMALSGLYLRWPRGVAARNWRSWIKINFKLKGRAFLFSLHSVLGTFALLLYMVSAHTGAFQSGGVDWYGSGVRTLLGAPQRPHLGGPGVPGEPGGPGSDRNTVRLIAMHANGYFTADGDAEHTNTSLLDLRTGELRPAPESPTGNGFGAALVADNQLLHEGRYFGRFGVFLMMLASLAMPAFYFTGWMMYLKRRRLKRPAPQPV